MRLLLVPAFIVALTACGADVEGACTAYVDAWTACIESAFVANVTDQAALLDAAEGTCADYTGLDDKSTEALLNCYAETYLTADCSDEQGYAAAGAALAHCG